MLSSLMAGCASNSISPLTPRHTFRSPDGYYLLEAQLDSTQRALRWETIKATAVVGTQTYEMRRTTFMTNRWETLVPIPAGQSTITYHFRFDYDCNTFGVPPQPNSTTSRNYKLEILPQQ
jgi:hypothetical protein